MQLTSRKIKETDLTNIERWWDSWVEHPIPKKSLPKTGFIVEEDKNPICAIFMFKTNSSTAAIQWVVSDKNYRKENRKQALQLLIKACEDEWRSEGGKHLFFWGNNKKFNKTLVEMGFDTGDTNYDQLIKRI